MTRTDAQGLRPGSILHHLTLRNADASPLRARVTGRIKLWITRPDEFRLPVKHGLRDSFYITERNAHEWTIAS